TPVLGTRLARDKFRTAQVLRQLGLPGPTHARATSPQHAVQLARRIGYPVVIKPADRDQGQGVSADLQDDAAVLAAFAFAARCSEHILVEKHADGRDYRLTILNGRLIKTIVRRAAGVVGDGQHSIAELVEQLRSDPAHRRAGQLRGHAPLELDAQAHALLAQHAMASQTVPDRGRFVALRRRANVSAGGTPELVVGGIHPDNQRLAERAALALQLDLAGVDLIMPDIGQSWLQTGALICEVKGQPQLGSSTTPGIYQQVLRELVSTPWRMPVVLVIDAGTQIAHRLHALLPAVPVASGAEECEWRSPSGPSRREYPWGVACADGVWEGAEQIAP
ncbi:MAG: acetate--CoA ligase family protein, partial [Rubrivivax sp.]|nr:acetate--CoA ligase family protein [Rubrivivax sp.]